MYGKCRTRWIKLPNYFQMLSICLLTAPLATFTVGCGSEAEEVNPTGALTGIVTLPAQASGEAGDLLVTIDNTLVQVGADGARKGEVDIPYPPQRPGTERARDLAVDGMGRIAIYNGTFSPLLSRFDPTSTEWSHFTLSGWSTANNVSYGGLASTLGTSVYVTDMATSASGAPRGIVRLHGETDTMWRPTGTADYIDVSYTMEGYVPFKALRSDGRTVDEMSVQMMCVNLPDCPMQVTRSIQLETQVRAIAITGTDTFAASWDGNIYRFDTDGQLVDSIASGAMNLVDIDLSPDGQIVVGSRFGEVILTDTSLSPPTSFSVGSTPVFVAFKAGAADLPGSEVPAAPIEGIVATASSEYWSSYYAASNLVDGNSNTLWVGGWNQKPWTVTLELGGTKQLDQLELEWYYRYVSTDFDVEVSADGGQSYEPVVKGAAADPMTAWPYRSVFTVAFERATATHVRVTIRNASTFFPVLSEARLTGWDAP